jgi:hypothetical protein
MEYNNIFQINKNTKCFEDKHIIQLLNKNFNTEPNIKIKFLKSVCVDLIIGFSMNLEYMDIKLNKNIVRIEKITRIKLFVQPGDKIEFQPSKLNAYYEVYLYIVDIKSLKSNISKINLTNGEINSGLETISETQLDFYPNHNHNQLKTNNIFDGIKKIIIITTKFIQTISDYFKIIFEKRGIRCKIKYSLDIEDCLRSCDMVDTIFLIMFNNSSHFLLPNKFIFYQIEQLGSIFLIGKKFLSRLKYSCLKSIMVWEYTNLTSNIYSKYCEGKLKYVPMPFVLNKEINSNNLNLDNWDNLKYDIFFYGNKNLRREKILNELSKYFKIKIGWGVYGQKKIDYILRSKIILNLHYYEKAGLETCRFNEILNYNKVIISENSLSDISNMNLYSDLIVMVDNIDENLSNIDKLIEHIKHFLINDNYLKKINKNKIFIKKFENKIVNYL